MRVLATGFAILGVLGFTAGCRQIAPRLPQYGPGMAIPGTAVAVGVLPDGRVLAGAGDLLWVTDRSGSSESLTIEDGRQRAGLRDVRAIAVGPQGRIALADAAANRVWELELGPPAALKVLAGTGTAFYPIGDGARAIAAQLDGPSGLAWQPDGSLLIADTGHGRVRKAGTDGRIGTVAGTGLPGPNGDGGPATRAFLGAPGPLAAGPDGSFVVAESGRPGEPDGQRIRRVTSDGIISTLAPVAAAGLAIGPDGIVFASVGNGVRAYWDGGTVTIHEGLHGPRGLATLPDGAIVVADSDRILYLEPLGAR